MTKLVIKSNMSRAGKINAYVQGIQGRKLAFIRHTL